MATNEALGKTVSINGKRYYNVDGINHYPSVTTILGSMSDLSGLDEWRQSVGEEKADEIAKFAANRGTVMHQMNEYFLSCESKDKRERLRYAQTEIIGFVKEQNFTEAEMIIGRKLFFNFYNAGLFETIVDVVSLEDMLFSHRMGGYAGRVDTIFIDKLGRILILDFKSSKKPKKKEWILNYYRQIAAYFIAYWEMTGKKPAGGQIWISNEEDNEPQVFEVTLDDIKKHGAEFLQMVKNYHAKYPLISIS